MIPSVNPCRYLTIGEIKKKIQEDNFTYRSVRVASKIKAINGFRAEVEDPFSEGSTLMVDIYLLKLKTLEAGMLVEFIGEIE